MGAELVTNLSSQEDVWAGRLAGGPVQCRRVAEGSRERQNQRDSDAQRPRRDALHPLLQPPAAAKKGQKEKEKKERKEKKAKQRWNAVEVVHVMHVAWQLGRRQGIWETAQPFCLQSVSHM